MSSSPPTNQLIRRCLAHFCCTDSELDKFLLDTFPDVGKNCTSGMETLQKVNLLLKMKNNSDIIEAIKKEYTAAKEYISDSWAVEPIKLTADNTGRVWFSQDFGNGFTYRNGPLVVTYLSPNAKLSVFLGPPWEPIKTMIELIGATFKGEFYVEPDWSISGESETCICSGYYPNHGQPLANGEHVLPSGGRLYRHFGKQSLIILPNNGDNLESRKITAVKEAKILLGRDFPDPDWRVDDLRKQPGKLLLAYLDII